MKKGRRGWLADKETGGKEVERDAFSPNLVPSKI